MKYLILFLLFITAAHAENRTKVAVVDTGISFSASLTPYICKTGNKDLTGYGLIDRHGHGTNIAGLIAKNLNPKHQCLLIIKWIDYADQGVVSPAILSKRISIAINYAVKQKAKYVNLSLDGSGQDLSEKASFAKALALGLTVAVAAGNQGKNLSIECDVFPACYRFSSSNFFVVANYQGSFRVSSSNYGGPVNAKENGVDQEAGGYVMTGTSQSTAVFLGKLVKEREETNAVLINDSSSYRDDRMSAKTRP